MFDEIETIICIRSWTFDKKKYLCACAGGYVIVDEKLPRFVVPDLTDFKVMVRQGLCPHFTDLIAGSADSKCQIVFSTSFTTS